MKCLISTVAITAFVVGGLPTARSAELFLEYTFNDSGPLTQGSERAAWDWPLAFQTQVGEPADWHGVAGSGVSGKPEDRAFDNSAASAMGSPGEGGRALGRYWDRGPLASATFSGWLRTESQVAGTYARLLFWEDGGHVYARPDACLRLFKNGVNATSDPVYDAIDEWMFFAITFDGTVSEDNVKFWKGARAEAVSLVSTRSLPEGLFDPSGSPISLGNSYSYSTPTQPFDGMMDNVRLHGGEGTSGILSPAEIEALRASDVEGTFPGIRVRPQLELKLASGPPAGLAFTWWSILGYDYQLQESANLTTWSDVTSLAAEGDGKQQERTLTPLPATPMFYRLEVLPRE